MTGKSSARTVAKRSTTGTSSAGTTKSTRSRVLAPSTGPTQEEIKKLTEKSKRKVLAKSFAILDDLSKSFKHETDGSLNEGPSDQDMNFLKSIVGQGEASEPRPQDNEADDSTSVQPSDPQEEPTENNEEGDDPRLRLYQYIPSATSNVTDEFLKQFGQTYLAEMIRQSLMVLPRSSLELTLESLKGPMTHKGFEEAMQQAAIRINCIQVGFQLGMQVAKTDTDKRLDRVSSEIKELRQTLKDTIETSNKNSQKFQQECSDVSKEMRSMVQKIEAVLVKKTARADPNLEVYHKIMPSTKKQINFKCSDRPCSISWSMEGVEPSLSIKGFKLAGVSNETMARWGGIIKKEPYDKLKTLEGMDIAAALTNFHRVSTSSAKSDIDLITDFFDYLMGEY